MTFWIFNAGLTYSWMRCVLHRWFHSVNWGLRSLIRSLFLSLMDLKSLWLTANTETVYASIFLVLKKDGSTVIELPPNVLGILSDMWVRYVGDVGNTGPDKEKSGKFLILPPAYKGDVADGYHVFRSRTIRVWFTSTPIMKTWILFCESMCRKLRSLKHAAAKGGNVEVIIKLTVTENQMV